MTKVEKARELIEKYGFSRNSYKTGEQYEKTYNARYSRWIEKVIVTIELYTDEDDAEYAEANIENVEIDDCADFDDLKAVQDAIEQAVDDFEEIQDEIDDLEGDKEEIEQNEYKKIHK
jgi:hypothetical protein